MKKLLCAVMLVLFVGGLLGCSNETPKPADNATKAAPAEKK
jgi:hypothetical protein